MRFRRTATRIGGLRTIQMLTLAVSRRTVQCWWAWGTWKKFGSSLHGSMDYRSLDRAGRIKGRGMQLHSQWQLFSSDASSLFGRTAGLCTSSSRVRQCKSTELHTMTIWQKGKLLRSRRRILLFRPLISFFKCALLRPWARRAWSSARWRQASSG